MPLLYFIGWALSFQIGRHLLGFKAALGGVRKPPLHMRAYTKDALWPSVSRAYPHTCVCCPASYARISIVATIPYSAGDLFGFISIYE